MASLYFGNIKDNAEVAFIGRFSTILLTYCVRLSKDQKPADENAFGYCNTISPTSHQKLS
jgi:hypothetical protein